MGNWLVSKTERPPRVSQRVGAQDTTAGNEVFSAIAFINLILAARFGYFRVGLLVAGQESIAIGLRGPTPHGS